MTRADWDDPELALLAVEMRTASGSPEYTALEYAVFVVFNAGAGMDVAVPDAPDGQRWSIHIDTAAPGRAPTPVSGSFEMPSEAVVALVLEASE
jgi:glycogen operon protein